LIKIHFSGMHPCCVQIGEPCRLKQQKRSEEEEEEEREVKIGEPGRLKLKI
jgi:hypothetical protein